MKFSLVGQTIVDTTIYFHSKYNTILEGMICKYYFFSDYDYEKYKENRKKASTFNLKLKSKYIPFVVEYFPYKDSIISPYNAFYISSKKDNFYFNFPICKYRINMNEIGDLKFNNNYPISSWGLDNEKFMKLKFHYNNDNCVNIVEIKGGTIEKNIIENYLNSNLHMIELTVFNKWKEELKMEFVFD